MTATDDSGADRTIPLNGPTLDCDRDAWLGTFPGLGVVRVEEDGTVTVDVDNADVLTAEERSNRERALRFGWGEPLSFARRGFWCAGGAAAVPPRSDGCVLLLGDPHEVANVMLELAARGWAMMGDRVTPLEWQGDDLVAHPRAAPLLVSRRTAERAGVESHSVRANSDSRIVELLRAREPRNVVAIVLLRPRKPADARFTPLFGHERFAVGTRGEEQAVDSTQVVVEDVAQRPPAAGPAELRRRGDRDTSGRGRVRRPRGDEGAWPAVRAWPPRGVPRRRARRA